jgi:hypothetical protein
MEGIPYSEVVFFFFAQDATSDTQFHFEAL